MGYLVCQKSKCQQTYPIKDFSKDSKDVACEKCGGVLIDKDGRANMSQNATVIPVITAEELEVQRLEKIKRKHKELAALEREIQVLEDDEEN
ncbi:hypothetical protein [Psychrobacillus sp. FSL K6-1464]|uniref:hypothetical protein n=1 Tax=Psychrobacillus sp. FSL K6-1464 TaxID=2921545 RepID=UPI0030FBD60C